MQIKSIVYTILVRFILFLISLFFIPFLIIIALIPQKYRWSCKPVYYCMHFFYWLILKGSFLTIVYKGLENVPNEASILVANHQSSLDIPLLGFVAGVHPHVWLARAELMDTFVLRWILPILAVVADVTSTRAAMVSLRRILTILNEQKSHLMIFPEGSRFDDGALHEFFNGFVIIAKKTGRAVVPVYINGVNKIYPRGSFLIHPHIITVTVGKAFFLQADETDELFKKRVTDWFVAHIETAPA